jgi:hypothetical protein
MLNAIARDEKSTRPRGDMLREWITAMDRARKMGDALIEPAFCCDPGV